MRLLVPVHKLENLLGPDFEFFTRCARCAKILRFCKRIFLIEPLLWEKRLSVTRKQSIFPRFFAPILFPDNTFTGYFYL
jgi:hypothetical protein